MPVRNALKKQKIGKTPKTILTAAGSWGYLQASEHLKEFTGLFVSSVTIREICGSEEEKISQWQQSDSACESFRNAKGDKEFTADATSVNTIEDGWRMMNVALFSKAFSSSRRNGMSVENVTPTTPTPPKEGNYCVPTGRLYRFVLRVLPTDCP